MSPAVAAAAPLVAPAVPSLCEGLVMFLNLLLAGARPGGALEVRAWSRHGFGFQRLLLSRPEAGRFEVLPDPILRLLEDGDWALTVGAAVRASDGTTARTLGVLFARFRFARQWRGDRWTVDPEAVAAAVARLTAFPLAPSCLLDAATELVAVWALTVPLLLDAEAGRARATRLQRGLAERLGASTADGVLTIPSRTGGAATQTVRPDDDPAGFLPLPGGIVREAGDPPPVVRVLAIDPSRVSAVEVLETALTAPTAEPARRADPRPTKGAPA